MLLEYVLLLFNSLPFGARPAIVQLEVEVQFLDIGQEGPARNVASLFRMFKRFPLISLGKTMYNNDIQLE